MGQRSPAIASRAAVLVLVCAGAAFPAAAQKSPSWGQVKCARYTTAWTNALARLGTHGLGQAFLERHATFLASGCTGVHDVCPRSTEEFNLANIMVIQSMNAGTASTFAPFACPQ